MTAVVAHIDRRRELLARYVARGLRLVFWSQEHGKGPKTPGWQTKTDNPADWHEGLNVGTFTGHEISPSRFLADVDLDWPEGAALAKRLLPETGFGFGHGSRKVTHALYTTPEPQVSRSFNDLNGKPFVELRGTDTDGSVGHQTMIAPSIHPSGEPVELRMDGEIAHASDLQRRVKLLATACMLKKYLGWRGLRHDERLAVAGFLLRLGLAEKEVIDVCEAVAADTGNDVNDVASTVRDTAERLENDAPATGVKVVAKVIGGNDGKRVVGRIREWFADGVVVLGDGDVRMEGGKLTEIVDKAEAALLRSATTIFNRGGSLVRPVRLDAAMGEAIRREVGSTVLIAVKESWLLEAMGQSLRWYRGNAQADPQALYARTLLGRGEWRFPVLRSVLTIPTLARDGRIIQTPGFDTETGLLLDFQAGAFPPIPASPTLDDALFALKRLAHPFRGFPFASEAAKSTALAAVLTGLIRPSLRTSPIAGFDAPEAGTGKSLLAESVSLVATGLRPPALSQGKTAEEDEKRLATVLFAGDPIIHIDNCERPISGDFLCSMTTQEVVQARILGLSERRVLPCTSLVLVSGNNLTFAGDTSRRSVVCRLDANVERPDTREFDFDCHAEIIANRAELVVEGLTILRAYDVAGRPEHLTPMGSFSDWDWIRGSLVWLGMADPADTRQAILDNDPRRDELLDVMELWDQAFRGQPIEVADIAERSCDTAVKRLYDKLIEVACRGCGWSGKSVGWWLRRNKDRVVSGGRCFRCDDTAGRNGQRWRLATVGAGCQMPLRVEE